MILRYKSKRSCSGRWTRSDLDTTEYSMLSTEQRTAYWNDGFIFPVQYANAEEVHAWYRDLSNLRKMNETAWLSGDLNSLQKWLQPIAERRSIIDRVASLLGQQIRIQNEIYVLTCLTSFICNFYI